MDELGGAHEMVSTKHSEDVLYEVASMGGKGFHTMSAKLARLGSAGTVFITPVDLKNQ